MTNINIYEARLSRILFIGPIILFLITLGISVYLNDFQIIFLLGTGGAILWLLITWLTYKFSYLIIREKQLILCTGIIIRQTIDIPMDKVESIDIRQTILGSIFRYGTLIITGTGGSRQIINYVSQPLTCRRYIEQSMHEVWDEKGK